MLTKEKCEKALNRICFNYGLNALDGETNEIMDMKFSEDIIMLKLLINEHFDLIERIVPVKSKCSVPNKIEYHEDKKMIEKYVQYDIIKEMVEFLFKENVVEFTKEQDYSRFQTIHKGKIYIVKPKGDNDESN